MRKNISWTKKIALAVAAGAIMVASAVPVMAAEGCTHVLGEATDGEAKVEATCISEGYTLKACKLCGELVKTDVKAATGHNFNAVNTTKTNEGKDNEISLTYHICNDCGFIEVLESNADQTAKGTCQFKTYTNVAEISLKIDGEQSFYILKNGSDSELTDGETASCTNNWTISICQNCGKVVSEESIGEHNYVLIKSVIKSNYVGSYTFKCSNKKCTETLTFEAASAKCINGEHVESTEKAGVCANCGADVNAAAVTPATPSDEEPSEEPAETTETKVSSGTVVGGGIAAAGILTLITLIVKYLGSVLF
jgi:hypothetical protein